MYNDFSQLPDILKNKFKVITTDSKTKNAIISRSKRAYVNFLNVLIENNDELINNYIGSEEEVMIKCGKCNNIFISTPRHYMKRFSKCINCGDKISYPEKIICLLLNELQLSFETQYRFDNYKYKYDIKVNECIIEIHGEQHYGIGGCFGIDYKKEHENDLVKYDLAVLHGYEYNKTYFTIDCRNSKLEWIKNSIEQCMFFKQFDLTNIDWKDIDKKAQDSLKIQICYYWNNTKKINPNLTVNDVAKELGVNSCKVRSSLKWGTTNGICYYNPEHEKQKCFNRMIKNYVYFIKPNGEKWFNEKMCISKLSKITGIYIQPLQKSLDEKRCLGGTSFKYDSKYIGSYVVLVDEWDKVSA